LKIPSLHWPPKLEDGGGDKREEGGDKKEEGGRGGGRRGGKEKVYLPELKSKLLRWVGIISMMRARVPRLLSGPIFKKFGWFTNPY